MPGDCGTQVSRQQTSALVTNARRGNMSAAAATSSLRYPLSSRSSMLPHSRCSWKLSFCTKIANKPSVTGYLEAHESAAEARGNRHTYNGHRHRYGHGQSHRQTWQSWLTSLKRILPDAVAKAASQGFNPTAAVKLSMMVISVPSSPPSITTDVI